MEIAILEIYQPNATRYVCHNDNEGNPNGFVNETFDMNRENFNLGWETKVNEMWEIY